MQTVKKEPELVSPQFVADMLSVEVRTVYHWVHLARNKPSPDSIPIAKIPGSRLLRFPLKEIREWYQRGGTRIEEPEMSFR